jgi:hypothetical protein
MDDNRAVSRLIGRSSFSRVAYSPHGRYCFVGALFLTKQHHRHDLRHGRRWTNGLFTATPHQVIDLPRYKDIIPERFSIAFFCNVNKDVMLNPMTHLNDNDNGAATTKTYEPIKAIDYITMRLSQTISST